MSRQCKTPIIHHIKIIKKYLWRNLFLVKVFQVLPCIFTKNELLQVFSWILQRLYAFSFYFSKISESLFSRNTSQWLLEFSKKRIWFRKTLRWGTFCLLLLIVEINFAKKEKVLLQTFSNKSSKNWNTITETSK